MSKDFEKQDGSEKVEQLKYKRKRGANGRFYRRPKKHKYLRMLLIVPIIIVILVFILRDNKIGLSSSTLKIIKACGYEQTGDFSFRKDKIELRFDFSEEICYKNQYRFSMENQYVKDKNKYDLHTNFLEGITNCIITDGKIEAQDYTPPVWTELSPIVCHAGGAICEPDGTVTYYTNSLEALAENYSMGSRVFEFDFYLTSDNQLAVVHDWRLFGYKDGTFLSAAEWKSMKTNGSPETGKYYTTMMIGDLLDEMMVNRDIYIVTDTKSMEFTDEQIRLQFELIKSEAQKRDSSLLNRIIPQIYNQDMYNIVKDVYDFENIIYTTYGSEETNEDIISYVNNHKDIVAVTTPIQENRFEKDQIDELHKSGKKIYYHTVNDYSDLSVAMENNADGIYSAVFDAADISRFKK